MSPTQTNHIGGEDPRLDLETARGEGSGRDEGAVREVFRHFVLQPGGDRSHYAFGIISHTTYKRGCESREEGQADEVQPGLRWHDATVMLGKRVRSQARKFDPAEVASKPRAPDHVRNVDPTAILEQWQPVVNRDSEVAALRSQFQESRYQGMRQFVSWLSASGPLRRGLSKDDAAAVVWALTSPEVHTLLRSDRGWPPERYTRWLADTLRTNLLP